MVLRFILRKVFPCSLYVRVSKNKFEITHIETKKQTQVVPEEPFATQRLLIGEFLIAEECLRKAFHDITNRWTMILGPTVIIHPLEMIEGGLSPIEYRVLREVAYGAGAKNVKIWIGHVLSDQEVLEKIVDDKDTI